MALYLPLTRKPRLCLPPGHALGTSDEAPQKHAGGSRGPRPGAPLPAESHASGHRLDALGPWAGFPGLSDAPKEVTSCSSRVRLSPPRLGTTVLRVTVTALHLPSEGSPEHCKASAVFSRPSDLPGSTQQGIGFGSKPRKLYRGAPRGNPKKSTQSDRRRGPGPAAPPAVKHPRPTYAWASRWRESSPRSPSWPRASQHPVPTSPGSLVRNAWWVQSGGQRTLLGGPTEKTSVIPSRVSRREKPRTERVPRSLMTLQGAGPTTRTAGP